jgi:hypothetical protein
MDRGLTQLQKNEPKQLKCLRRAQNRTVCLRVAAQARLHERAARPAAAHGG